jgi:hypothetical protein
MCFTQPGEPVRRKTLYLADPEPALLRALGPIPELATELWLVTYKSLKGTARVRAFMELVGDGVRRSLAAELRPEPARAAG